MRIRKQSLDQGIHHIQTRQDTSAAKTFRPPAALAQFPGLIHNSNLSRDESESFLCGPTKVARHLEEGDHLHIVRKPPECFDFFDVYRSAGRQMRERIAR